MKKVKFPIVEGDEIVFILHGEVYLALEHISVGESSVAKFCINLTRRAGDWVIPLKDATILGYLL